jgi:hypothetical protein
MYTHVFLYVVIVRKFIGPLWALVSAMGPSVTEPRKMGLWEGAGPTLGRCFGGMNCDLPSATLRLFSRWPPCIDTKTMLRDANGCGGNTCATFILGRRMRQSSAARIILRSVVFMHQIRNRGFAMLRRLFCCSGRVLFSCCVVSRCV